MTRSIERLEGLPGIQACEEKRCCEPAAFIKRWEQMFTSPEGFRRRAQRSRLVCDVHAKGFARRHKIEVPS